jgi:hypothetical protein
MASRLIRRCSRRRFRTWAVGETFMPGRERLRILAIETVIAEELVEQGFNGVFTVEPNAPCVTSDG